MVFTTELIISLAALFVSFSAVVVSVVAMWNDHQQKKITNLVTLHKFLHTDEMSEARRKVRDATSPLPLDDLSVRRVCYGFDFAGTLVNNNAVDRDLFLDHWCNALVLISKRLEHLREPGGKGLFVEYYYKDFCWLLDEAKRKHEK